MDLIIVPYNVGELPRFVHMNEIMKLIKEENTMAKEIYNFCQNYSFMNNVSDNTTLRRAIMIAAMEFAIEKGKAMSECLNSATINEVIRIFGR